MHKFKWQAGLYLAWFYWRCMCKAFINRWGFEKRFMSFLLFISFLLVERVVHAKRFSMTSLKMLARKPKSGVCILTRDLLILIIIQTRKNPSQMKAQGGHWPKCLRALVARFLKLLFQTWLGKISKPSHGFVKNIQKFRKFGKEL